MKWQDLKVGMRVRVVRTTRGFNEMTLGHLATIIANDKEGEKDAFPFVIVFDTQFAGGTLSRGDDPFHAEHTLPLGTLRA